MKIDFVISSLVGSGAERVMVLISKYLLEQNNEVSIITFNEPDAYILPSNLKRVRLHDRSNLIKNHTVNNLYNLFRYYRKKNNRPDIIISFMTVTNLISILIAKIFGIRIIVSEHTNHRRNTSSKEIFTKKYVYRFANLLTVLTSHDVAYYQKYKANVTVMPNPCTFTKFEGTRKFETFSFLAAGHLDRYQSKGFDNLIEILAPILKKNKNWVLKIAGKGDIGTRYLKKMASDIGISNQVIFMGFQEDMAKVMQESEVFVLTSKGEGLPMVLLEAMSQGMVCVSYDCFTGPSDIITNTIDGLLVEDQNKESMRRVLNQVVEDEKLRDRLRKNALKIVDKFSMELIGKKWEEDIQKVLHNQF